MAIKRGIIVVITGLLVETAILWAVDYFAHFNLRNRIIWSNLFLWGFFVTGFCTSWWLIGWTKLLNKLFFKSKKGSADQKTEPAAKPEENTSVQPTTKPEVPVNAPAPTAVPRMAPVRMAVQNNAILTVNAQNTPAVTPSPTVAAPSMSATPAVPPSPAAQKDKDISLLADLDTDLDMMAFKHVALEGKILDLVYSSDDIAVLCKIFSEPHTWTVDTSQPIENSVWTDETGATQQPALALLAQAAILEKMESSAKIIPTIVLMRGTISNYDEAIQYLEQNQISVVKYQNEANENFKTIHEILIENFSLFPEGFDANAEDEMSEEEDTDTQTVDQEAPAAPEEEEEEDRQTFDQEAPETPIEGE